MANRYYTLQSLNASVKSAGRFKPAGTMGSHSMEVLRISGESALVKGGGKKILLTGDWSVRYNCGEIQAVKPANLIKDPLLSGLRELKLSPKIIVSSEEELKEKFILDPSGHGFVNYRLIHLVGISLLFREEYSMGATKGQVKKILVTDAQAGISSLKSYLSGHRLERIELENELRLSQAMEKITTENQSIAAISLIDWWETSRHKLPNGGRESVFTGGLLDFTATRKEDKIFLVTCQRNSPTFLEEGIELAADLKKLLFDFAISEIEKCPDATTKIQMVSRFFNVQ